MRRSDKKEEEAQAMVHNQAAQTDTRVSSVDSDCERWSIHAWIIIATLNSEGINPGPYVLDT
jgi:hypothetical protein